MQEKQKGEKAKLACRICNTDVEVPMCCDEGMAIEKGELVCHLCGSEKTIPICCGRNMKHSLA